MINTNSPSKIPPPPPPRMSMENKGGSKRRRAIPVAAPVIETPSAPTGPAAGPAAAAAAAAAGPAAAAAAAGPAAAAAAAHVHQQKKPKCGQPAIITESVVEAPLCSQQSSQEGVQPAKNIEGSSSSSTSLLKKDDGFKRNYTSTVQNSYSGKSNFENNKFDLPSTSVFALSLLEWKFGKSTPEVSATTRREKGSGGVGGETLEEEFRRECVKPRLEAFIETAEPELKEALKFILSAAESDINNKDCCSEGGGFPIMQQLKINVMDTEIGFSLFEYSPLPGKYDPATISRSYFASLKKLIYFLLGHPLFLFQNQSAQKGYFEEVMATIHDALVKEIANVKESKKSELLKEKEIMSGEIQSLEEMVFGIRAEKDQNAEIAKEKGNQIESVAEKIRNAQRAHEKMEEAVNSMTACMDCDSNKEIYENMKQIGKKDLQSFIEKQNTAIAEMETLKNEIEEKDGGLDVDIKNHEERISQIQQRMNDTEKVSRLDNETEESVIKARISHVTDSFVKTFDPILQCIMSSQTAKKKLMEIMKKMTESEEVVQDGIMAIKTSVELFLENKLKAQREATSTTHAASVAVAVPPYCGPPPPPIPTYSH